ncbi:MAG: hypothetical protein ACKO2G_07920 [Verrucomicrobiales bacterium]
MAPFTEKDPRALVVVGLLATAAFLLLAFLIKSGFGRSDADDPSTVPWQMPTPPPDAAEREKLARGVMETVLAAKGWRQWLPLVRDPARVEPMMRSHHEIQGHGLIPGGTSLWRMTDAGSAERIACSALLRLPDGEILPFAFVWSNGAFRFDWEDWSAHGSIAWREWIDLRPSREHELRVLVEAADASIGSPPGAPTNWKRVTLSHRDSPVKSVAWLTGEKSPARFSASSKTENLCLLP